MFSVRFLPEERTFAAEGPTELFLAAASCEIWIEQPCGTRSSCGKCRVLVREGAPAPTDADLRVVSPQELEAGWRLGCRLVLDGPAVVEIPKVTRSVAAKSFGDPAMYEGRSFTPNFRQQRLEMPAHVEHQPPPAPAQQLPHFAKLHLAVPLELLRRYQRRRGVLHHVEHFRRRVLRHDLRLTQVHPLMRLE